MNSDQFNLCHKMLSRLKEAGVLEHMVLIGSWCLPIYENYFKQISFHPGFRTRDIDLLIPIPLKLKKHIDLEPILRDLDFIISQSGEDGYIRFVHQMLMLEFIVPERGKGTTKPYELPILGINAQPLRFMDFLNSNTIQLPFGDLDIKVPHPVNFALLKLLIANRRQQAAKQENDLRQGMHVIKALIDSGETAYIREVFESLPNKWKTSIQKSASEFPLKTEATDLFK